MGLFDDIGDYAAYAYGGAPGAIGKAAFDEQNDTASYDPNARSGPPRADPTLYYYGGERGLANDEALRMSQLGASWGGMQAPQIDYSGANRYSGLADQSRAEGLNALGLQREAAMGNAPSQAAILMGQANDQAMANQMSLAAGARGPAAMAMSQQSALGNQANMATQSANNIGALRAQEMAQARGAYSQQTAALRAQDLQAQGMSADQAYRQAGLEMQQRGLGAQTQLAYENLGYGIRNSQLAATQGLAQTNASLYQGQTAANMASRRAQERNALEGAKLYVESQKTGTKPSY